MAQICGAAWQDVFFLPVIAFWSKRNRHRRTEREKTAGNFLSGDTTYPAFLNDKAALSVQTDGGFLSFLCVFFSRASFSSFRTVLNFLYSGQARCTHMRASPGRVRSKKTYASDRGTLRGIRPSRRRRSLLRPRDAARGVLRITATYLTARDTG